MVNMMMVRGMNRLNIRIHWIKHITSSKMATFRISNAIPGPLNQMLSV